jgi:uncharacterized protein (UPF0548 family)
VVLDGLAVRGDYHKLALQYGSAFTWNRLRCRSRLVILLREPYEACIRRFLEEQRSLPFSYPEVGASRDGALLGYPTNHHRGRLGTGQETFARARQALRRWEMYRLGWTELFWPGAPIAEGTVVGILGRHLGVWSLNACRIAYTVGEETPSLRRYGFAFGTLPGHVEQGEERFTVEWQGEDDSVWYEVFAFARPAHPLARAGRPFVRLVQRRFAVDSFRAMAAAVDAGWT